MFYRTIILSIGHYTKNTKTCASNINGNKIQIDMPKCSLYIHRGKYDGADAKKESFIKCYLACTGSVKPFEQTYSKVASLSQLLLNCI